MNKDQEKELKRLEEALMADMAWEEEPEEEPLEWEEDPLEWVEEYYEKPPIHCDVYNTDQVDVDLEEFSEEVHRGRSSVLLPTLITLLALALLGVMVLWLLRYVGVMG